ncbi:signal recognition particle-docking protein FtsY [Acidianus manzaensis]|uniref:Signal recognition particle receptor FtsY n=1 Tax=Acidianus manzaensis TaxID=282676 RepID=A0A1W6K1V5_9CREN|nr:signal recognition particle-docking protein FtsY [Acidianus manzaensis]ARM76477.1 signal recognition particle-docking protein FtsY [Acidianus manzaensis]
MICFDKLKKAFSNFTDKLRQKENTEQVKQENEKIEETNLAQHPLSQNEEKKSDEVESKPQSSSYNQNIPSNIPSTESTLEENSHATPNINAQESEKKQSSSRFNIFNIFRYKELKEDDINDIIEELRYELLESDVSLEVTDKILEDLKNALIGKKVSRSEDLENLVKESLKKSIKDILEKNKSIDDLIDTIKKSEKPYVIVFFGINGVGKTTTIAKFAYMLKEHGLKVIVSASDTFRAAAQEQLALHCEKLKIPLVKGKYGGDPASVAFDAIKSAKSRNIDVVLIDTAGRMHVDKDLTEELKRIIRIAKPNLKLLVLDSLAGNDALEQAKYFDEIVNYDGVILTKVDADAKGGIVLSLAYELKKPVLYIGIGQEYSDLTPFSVNWFMEKLFS